MTLLAIDINRARLNQRIAQLAEIGQLPNGGVCRLAYSLEDVRGRELIQTWMEAAGTSVRVDAAGNLIGTYAGKQAGAPAIAMGSHSDTVPLGGRYDGTLGILAGIEVVQSLREADVRLHHPLEIIVFADEEGGMLGSKAMAGEYLPSPEEYRTPDGAPIQDALGRLGGDWERLETARRSRSDLAAFIELHVEQGGVLEALGKTIGVVEGIVCQRRLEIAIAGSANHAGTTPMSVRRDALVAAAQVVLAVEELGKQPPGEQVATVGKLQVQPNAANIVPGMVELSVDMRALCSDKVREMEHRLRLQLAQIADRTHTKMAIAPILDVAPTLAQPHVQAAIATGRDRLGLNYTYLPSRASHDAQAIGRITDMGMIFVPSAAGVSHAEREYTSPLDCARGAEVLLHTCLQLDEYYRSDRSG